MFKSLQAKIGIIFIILIAFLYLTYLVQQSNLSFYEMFTDIIPVDSSINSPNN